jgi:hypothetical protein
VSWWQILETYHRTEDRVSNKEDYHLYCICSSKKLTKRIIIYTTIASETIVSFLLNKIAYIRLMHHIFFLIKFTLLSVVLLWGETIEVMDLFCNLQWKITYMKKNLLETVRMGKTLLGVLCHPPHFQMHSVSNYQIIWVVFSVNSFRWFLQEWFSYANKKRKIILFATLKSFDPRTQL